MDEFSGRVEKMPHGARQRWRDEIEQLTRQ
jgi:hypothetical protein